jgi:hypothetical protein
MAGAPAVQKDRNSYFDEQDRKRKGRPKAAKEGYGSCWTKRRDQQVLIMHIS